MEDFPGSHVYARIMLALYNAGVSLVLVVRRPPECSSFAWRSPTSRGLRRLAGLIPPVYHERV